MSTEIIADSPRLVHAMHDTDTDNLHIVVSKAVKEGDPSFDPVRDTLAEHEWELLSSELRRDPSLWFGRGWYITVQLKGPREAVPANDLFKELSMS